MRTSARTIAVLVLLALFLVYYHNHGLTARADENAADKSHVVVDCSSTNILNDFGDEHAREILLRHLSASANWTVSWHLEATKTEKVVSAEYRPKHHRKESDSLTAAPETHVTLGFGTPGPPDQGQANNTFAKAGAKRVELRLFAAPDDSKLLGSDLIVAGNSLFLEIREFSASRDRTLSKNAMQQVAGELSAVRGNVEEIERDGYLRKWLPNGSVKESVKDLPLQICKGPTRGMYWVSGYANPHEKGYVTIRTFHVRTGKELDADVNSWRTVQYLGWSSQRNEKFFFEFELAAPSYLTEEESKMDSSDPRRFQAMAAEQEIRVEVWFHGKEDRKLLEAKKILVPWMR